MTTTTVSPLLTTGKSARYTLPLLLATFVLPFLVGTGLFWSGWRPEKFGNHGELIQPPRPMPESGLLRTDGQPLPSANLRGKWLLVLSVEGSCAAPCLESLQQMTRVHRALNKEQDRLRRVLITSERGPVPTGANPDLITATLDAQARAAWINAFAGAEHGLFITDPMGNVIMRYPEPTATRGVLKDLERLLKYSWIH